jgi:SAM-dependent methyltransferase
MSSYLTTVYNEEDRPYTDYPARLCRFLFQHFHLSAGMNLLEAGCGRGEFLRGFSGLGLHVRGVDLSPEARLFSPDMEIAVSDIEKEGIPFPEASFDVVYSKSLLEHFRDPDRYLKEAHRVLKPGGVLLTLVPDWESCYKLYFDDYTHKTPFSLISLRDIYRIQGFTDVQVFKFRQLPLVWKYPALNYLCAALSPFVPVRTKTTFLKWSRELMLCGNGKKPRAL